VGILDTASRLSSKYSHRAANDSSQGVVQLLQRDPEFHLRGACQLQSGFVLRRRSGGVSSMAVGVCSSVFGSARSHAPHERLDYRSFGVGKLTVRL